MNATAHEAENILPNACDDHPYSSQPNPELLVTPTPLEPSSPIALTQPDPLQSQPASSNQDMELETDEASAEYTTVTYKKRRHSSDSVVLKTDVQPPDHPRGLTVIFTPINPQESLMKLNMKKVSDLLELHCPECILMVTIPDSWKLSWVCPIPKPGKKPDCASNMRPISLTSVLCKLMERMVLARIDWIIEQKRELLHPAQTRFLKNLGTQDSLVLIREYLMNRPTQCHRQLLVAVDIKKAFDTLPHTTVATRKLRVRGRPLNFIKSFLSGRKYLVKTGKHRGSTEKSQGNPTRSACRKDQCCRRCYDDDDDDNFMAVPFEAGGLNRNQT
ncbi:hypothetical protein ISCGN_001937 [Ixodes scapularis]